MLNTKRPAHTQVRTDVPLILAIQTKIEEAYVCVRLRRKCLRQQGEVGRRCRRIHSTLIKRVDRLNTQLSVDICRVGRRVPKNPPKIRAKPKLLIAPGLSQIIAELRVRMSPAAGS